MPYHCYLVFGPNTRYRLSLRAEQHPKHTNPRIPRTPSWGAQRSIRQIACEPILLVRYAALPKKDAVALFPAQIVSTKDVLTLASRSSRHQLLDLTAAPTQQLVLRRQRLLQPGHPQFPAYGAL